MEFDSSLFDSEIDNWKMNTSLFDQKIFGKEKLVFVVEDTEKNIFGVFVNKRIDNYRITKKQPIEEDKKEKKSDTYFQQWEGERITDRNAFLFSLRSNERLEKPMTFLIKKKLKDWAFKLYKQDWGTLFSMGGGNDISLKKENFKTKCYCKQQSFDYQGKENVLVGNEGKENTFEVKRIQVWQMKETEEWKKFRENRLKKEEEMKMKQTRTEQEIISAMNDEIRSEFQFQINFIQQWSGKAFKEIIWDSELSSWEINTTTFIKHIWNRKNVSFVMETTDGISFGLFLFAQIDAFRTKNAKGEIDGIVDNNAFLFSFKNNLPSKYPKRREMKGFPTFFLFKEDHTFLFSVRDFVVGKKGEKSWCLQDESSLFDYAGKEKALTGMNGRSNENKFDVRRIVVVQFE